MQRPPLATHSPLLTVVIPALVPDLELRRCIDSVRLVLPDPAECEIVLVVPARQLQAAAAGLPGVMVIAETRPSVYGAMNDGVKAGTGRYLYFLGKDDVVLPSLREAVEMLRSNAPRALFCDVYWGSEGVHRGRPSRWKILFRNVCHQGIIYSRGAVLEHGPYLRKMKVQADHLLNIKLLWDGREVRYFGAPIAWYAATGYSHTARDRLFHRLHPVIIRRHLGFAAGCLWRAYKKVRPDP
jgi:glycosyltransferase involved in cell wall biosynthesis